MINVIVPIVDKVESYLDFIKENKSKDVKFYIGIKENLLKKFNLRKNKNIEIHIFDNKSNIEEIINSLHSCKMEEAKTLVVRRPISKQEFVSLTTSSKDIVVLEYKSNKFLYKIKSFFKNIVRRFFSFSYFEDISAICFDSSMFQLLSEIQNFSMATRLNKYVGFEIEKVETEIQQVKKQYSKPKAILFLLLGIFILCSSIIGGTLVCVYCSTKALIVILVMFWIVFALLLFFVFLLNFARTLTIGDLRYGRANEIV